MDTNREPELKTNIGLECGTFRNVNIDKVENGFIVRVGCKTFVAGSWKLVTEALGLYYKNPKMAEEKYCSKR